MIYFDNAATTFPKPETVYTFTDKVFREYGVNVGRGQHKLSDMASRLVSETRELLLDLMHCPNKQVIFTPSATEALNVVLRGLNWRDEQTVYITPFEHNAVLRVLNYLGSIYKLNIREICVNKETLEYDIEKIKYQFQDDRPDVVIMSHASNVIGLIAPIKEICNLAKKYNAVTVIDMAQTAGLIDTDLSDIHADYAIFAGHKTLYAPFGIAGFISYKNISLSPLLYGGTGVDSANPMLPSSLPERFETGSPNIMAIAGLNASLKWITETTVEKIRKQEEQISADMIATLKKYTGIKLICRGVGDYIGVVSCNIEGYASDAVGQILSDCDIAVRTGLQCAPNAHRFLGTFPSGTVRFSASYFNTEDDINALNNALAYIQENS